MSATSSLRSLPKIYNRASPPDIPSWCPVCGYSIASTLDSKSFVDYGCCHSCETDTVNPNFLQWKSGWRPDAQYISDRLAERKDIALRMYYLRCRS